MSNASVTENFEYAMVKKVMNEDAGLCKSNAKAALNRGTEAMNAAIGGNLGESSQMALTGSAGQQINSKWTTLSQEFENFVREIDTRIENANLVGSTNQSFESTVSAYVGNGVNTQ